MATAKRTKSRLPTELARRGGDEVEFLGSRAEAAPMSASAARAELRGLRGRVASLVRHEGREAHEIGTALNTLYMRHADAALGHRSFRQLLLAEFGDDPRRPYEAMVVARAATAELAEEKGARWVLRAATWARVEGHDVELARSLERPVTTDDGRVVALRDATIRQIDEALGRRAQRAIEEPAGRRVQRARARVAELAAKDASVAALDPSIYLDAGEVVVRTVSRGPDDAKALRRLFAAVWSGR